MSSESHRRAAGAIDRNHRPHLLHIRRQGFRGLSGRHAGLGAAGGRVEAGGALFQIPPAPRDPHCGFGGTQCAGRIGKRRPTRTEFARHRDGIVRRARSPQPESLALTDIRLRGGSQLAVRAGFCRRVSTTRLSCGRRRSGKNSMSRRSGSAAGLGRASLQADPDTYEKAHAFCDVLIIGAGPAGLAAALSAGRSGARVVLCDEDFLSGGRLNADAREIDGDCGALWAQRTHAELASMPQVRVMMRTTVFGVYDGNAYAALERVSDHAAYPGTASTEAAVLENHRQARRAGVRRH